MDRDETLDAPASRLQFLDQVARGVDHDVAARALGMGGAFTVRRYAKGNPVFGVAFKEAKRQGLQARRAPERRAKEAARAAEKAAKKEARSATRADAPKRLKVPKPKPKPKPVKKASSATKKTRAQRAKKKAEDERGRAAAKDLAEVAAAVPSHTWLEEAELVEPEGLKLNPHLPPLSVKSHLAMCQRFAHDRTEHPAIRREAMRQIGMHTILPALRPPPPRNETGTASEVQQPALAIPGSGPRVVVLVAPDNGMYAPGCGPGQPTVVDEAEAADAELVTASAK